jgi:hypothetical protein
LFSEWAVESATKVEMTDAISASLNTMSHMMARAVERAASADVLAAEVGNLKGWHDPVLTLDYIEGVADYIKKNDVAPPALKPGYTHQAFDAFILDNAAAITEMLGGDAAFKVFKQKVAVYADGASTLENTIPSMSDIGAASMAVYERGAGIARGKLPVMTDQLKSKGQALGLESSTYVNQGLKDTIGWLHETTQLLEWDASGMVAMTQFMKLNLTALRPATFVNNVVSNYMAKMAYDGIDPITAFVQLGQAVKLARRAKYDPTSLAPHVLRDFHYLRDTGFDWSTFIDGEAVGAYMHAVKGAGDASTMAAATAFIQNIMHSGKLGGWDVPYLGKGMKKLTALFIDGYRQGDIIFKVDTASRDMAVTRAGLEQMRPGSRCLLRDINTGQTLGKVFKLKDGTFEFIDRRGRSTLIDNIDHPLINEARARSAMGTANARFVDFADVAGLLKIVKKFDWLVAGPFRTWIWSTIDIPGWKKGILYHTFFDDMPSMFSDPAIMGDLFIKSVGRQARRSMLGNIYNHVEPEDRFKRQLIPQYQAMTADFKADGTYTTVGSQNLAAGLFSILQAWEIETRPEGEKDYLRPELRREKGGPELLLKDILFGDGIMTQMWRTNVTGVSPTGRKLETMEDYVWSWADMLMPGYQAAGIDAATTYFDPLSDWSRYRLDTRLDPQQHMSTDAYLLKNLFGFRLSQYSHETQYQAWKAAPGALKSELAKKRKEIQENTNASAEQKLRKLSIHDAWAQRVTSEFQAGWDQIKPYMKAPKETQEPGDW